MIRALLEILSDIRAVTLREWIAMLVHVLAVTAFVIGISLLCVAFCGAPN